MEAVTHGQVPEGSYGIFRLSVPTPYPVGPVNLYLILGDEPALIDSGPGTEEAWQALQQGLAAHGLRIADLRDVVVTHAHLDHYGLAGRVQAEAGARIYAHPYSEPLLTDFRREWRRLSRFYEEVLSKAGIPRRSLMALGRRLQRGETFAGRPVEAVNRVHDGDQLVLGGIPWEVVHTPGHALGAICIYQRERKQIFTADHLLPEINSNPVIEPPPRGQTERPRCLVDYLASLRRVADLDVELVLPGHVEPFNDHRAVIAQRIAHREQRTERVRSLLSEKDQTVYELAQQVFTPDIPFDQLFLMVSETLGHLDILEARGECRVHERHGVWLYRRAAKEGT